MRFWLARLMGISANQMLMLGIAWHMYDITGSRLGLRLGGLVSVHPCPADGLASGAVDRPPSPWAHLCQLYVVTGHDRHGAFMGNGQSY